jgi:uncharacterized protein (TIGR03067 family)
MESTMFTFASRTFVIAMAAALIGRSLTASDVVDKIDDALLGKLQGEWSPTSSVFDGKPFTSGAGESTVVFEGRTMSIRFGDKVAGRLDIKHLVTNGELGHIDYEIVDPAGKTVRTKQLFKLDGDTLTTCVRSPPGERPDELTSKPGSKYLLTVLQRKKRKSTNGDEEDLQGLWQAVSLEANGKQAPEEQINEVQLLFKGDKVVFNPKHENREHIYKIDPKAKPKAMALRNEPNFRTIEKRGWRTLGRN